MLKKIVFGKKKSKWSELEKQQNRAGIRQFMSRRGVDWPSRQPLNNYTDLQHHLKQRQQDQPLEKRQNKDQAVDDNKVLRPNTEWRFKWLNLVNGLESDHESDHDDAQIQDNILGAYNTVRRNTKFCQHAHEHLDDCELSRSYDSHQDPVLNDHHIIRLNKDACLHAHTTLNNPPCVENKEKQVHKTNIRKRNCFLELNETKNIQNNLQRNYRHTENKTEHVVTSNILYPNLDEFFDDKSCPQLVIMESILSNPQLNTTKVRMNNLYPNLDEFQIVEDDFC